VEAQVDWHSLWAREPSLIPQGGEVVDAIDPSRSDHAPWGKIPKEDFDLLTAALARDAAVRWLDTNGSFSGFGHSMGLYGPPGQSMYRASGRYGDTYYSGEWSDSRDGALHSLCGTFLNARDKSKE
jgi:hypothetical protein